MILWVCTFGLLSFPAFAEILRIATYNTELARNGPGLLLRDIAGGKDAQIDAVVAVLVHTQADIVVVQGFDYDLTGAALAAFAKLLDAQGLRYPHQFALRPNTGMPTGQDMDGDGRLGGPRDAQGYGAFSGQGGMAVLSRYPVARDAVRDFSGLLWADLPGATLPRTDAGPFPDAKAQAAQRLSSTAHWVVPIDVPQVGRVTLLTYHATPPVFDGPEDRNGQRNADETRFWQVYLDGAFGPAPSDRFVLLGDANLDPAAGDGHKHVMRQLLDDPRLTDTAPTSAGAAATGDTTDTADWDDPYPGNLRADYVLPSADWTVTDSGVVWPAHPDPMADAVVRASRHHLVWVDLAW
ncbi:endonuclease/exonuclease/phosphatase family protein [Pseudosulfitobacter pseudonitzschiae]|uniref:endonuclease/exonuclease/phosphatase family protein n=1 Tax=Pseudosulfitobacter pseudonitzschiae TaxID=1402135 RepID=UPI0032E8C6D2